MQEWPITLPIYPLVDGYAEAAPNIVLRTKMDQGPDKVRMRSTAGVRQLHLKFLLTKAQATLLDTFYYETLAGGADRFLYTHPRTDEEVACRFVEPPEYVSVNGNYFRVSAFLEVLP